MTRSLGVGAFLERFEQARGLEVFSVCRGETLEKRPRSYLVKVVSRRDDDFPRRRIKELSMTMTFRPMSKPIPALPPTPRARRSASKRGRGFAGSAAEGTSCCDAVPCTNSGSRKAHPGTAHAQGKILTNG